MIRHLISAAVLLIASPLSFANFVDESGPDDQGAGKAFTVVNGMGQDIPLREALATIVPAPFAIRFDEAVSEFAKRPISWTGARPWNLVAADAARQVAEVRLSIDAKKQLVLVSSAKSPQANAGAKADPVQLEWKVQPGETLLSVTRRWGQEAGYKVFWNRDPELTLMAGATFPGSIEDALKGLNEAIKDSGFSFHALLTGNNLIRITGESSK